MLTKELFDALLEWLDPDREKAAQLYKKTQLQLIRTFEARGCNDAEDLADEVIDRVALKVVELDSYEGDRAAYFFGVARNIHHEDVRKSRRRREVLEYLKKNEPTSTPVESLAEDNEEEDFLLLDECMERLSQNDRVIVLEYYRAEKRVKIRYRTRLASKFGMTIVALRTKACRIRKELRKCMERTLNEATAH